MPRLLISYFSILLRLPPNHCPPTLSHLPQSPSFLIPPNKKPKWKTQLDGGTEDGETRRARGPREGRGKDECMGGSMELGDLTTTNKHDNLDYTNPY